jgi:Spy/CpxP family protein refolding chaperone
MMKKAFFRKLGLTLSMALFAIITAFAQPQGGHGRDGNRDKMAEELGLNDSQKTQLKTLNQEMAQKKRTIKESSQTQEQKKAAMDKIRTEQDAKMQSILTKEQYAKFSEARKNRPEGGHKGEMGPRKEGQAGSKGRPDFKGKPFEDLGLSGEQQAKFKAANQEMAQKRRAVVEGSQTQEQKKAAMDKIRTEHDAKIKSILTSEQYAKFSEARENRPKGGRKGEMGQGRPDFEKVSKELGLSNEQEAKFKSANEAAKAELESIRKSDMTQDEKKVALKEARATHDAKIKSILTKEQYERFNAAKQARKEKVENMKKGSAKKGNSKPNGKKAIKSPKLEEAE